MRFYCTFAIEFLGPCLTVWPWLVNVCRPTPNLFYDFCCEFFSFLPIEINLFNKSLAQGRVEYRGHGLFLLNYIISPCGFELSFYVSSFIVLYLMGVNLSCWWDVNWCLSFEIWRGQCILINFWNLRYQCCRFLKVCVTLIEN